MSNDVLGPVVVGACVLAILVVVVMIVRRRRSNRPHAESSAVIEEPVMEALLTSTDEGDDAPRMVFARTHDGTLYQGAFVAVDEGMIKGAPVLALGGPIVFRRAGGEPETMPPAWDRLASPVADIAELWMRFADRGERAGRTRARADDGARAGRRRR